MLQQGPNADGTTLQIVTSHQNLVGPSFTPQDSMDVYEELRDEYQLGDND